MLFATKRQPGWSLTGALACVWLAWLLAAAGGVRWQWWWPADGWATVGRCLAVVVTSDLLLTSLLTLLGGHCFRRRFISFARSMAGQPPAAVIVAGPAAAAEELLFRATVLPLATAAWGLPAGLLVSAAAFGLAHLPPRWALAGFGLWAAWEGFLLGMVLVLTGSLPVVMLVHACHDVTGYAALAAVRYLARSDADDPS